MPDICSRPRAHFIPHSKPFLILSIIDVPSHAAFSLQSRKCIHPLPTYLKSFSWRRSRFTAPRTENMHLDKYGECPVRAWVFCCTGKSASSCAVPGTDCCRLTHLHRAASAIEEERSARVWYCQLTIYLVKLGVRESCLVAFGNLSYPSSKPLHELSSPLVLKQEPEGFKSVQTDLSLSKPTQFL